MKKSLTSGVLVLAVLLMTGCVGGLKTNRTPVNIGFKPVIGHDTRADESVPFPEDRSFRVWAVNEGNGGVLINDETISHSADGWLSAMDWPQAEVTFEACWPEDLAVAFDRKDGLSLKGFDGTSGDVDILFAKAENEDYEIDERVTLHFDHILSRVEFRMLQSLSSEMQVKLRKIEMIGFAHKGDYNTNGEYMWKSGVADGSKVVFDAGDSPVDLTSSPVYIGEDFYTIPQLCRAQVKVTFDVRYGEASWITAEETIQNLDTDWQPSTHYTYTLNLTETKLVYTTGISNWNNR